MANATHHSPTQQNSGRYEHYEEHREEHGLGGFLIGLAVLIILAILLFAFGIPALRNGANNSNNSPVNNSGTAPSINAPGSNSTGGNISPSTPTPATPMPSGGSTGNSGY